MKGIGDVNLANLTNVARMRDLWSENDATQDTGRTKFYDLINDILLYHRLDKNSCLIRS